MSFTEGPCPVCGRAVSGDNPAFLSRELGITGCLACVAMNTVAERPALQPEKRSRLVEKLVRAYQQQWLRMERQK